jgi:hypothetical protein
MSEIKNFKLINGIGNKNGWMFLLDENNDVVKGFRNGTLANVKKYLASKYADVILGGFGKWGTERCRFISVITYELVKSRANREYTEADRMLAAAQSASTQLKAWRWEGLK